MLATSYPTQDAKQEDFVNKAIAAGFVPFVADRDLTGKIDPTDLTIDGRMAGHDIQTPWDDAPAGSDTPPPTDTPSNSLPEASPPAPPPPNEAPAATADSYETAQNTPLVVSATHGVLANDSDADGNALIAALVAGPSHGTLLLNDDGSFTYAPACRLQRAGQLQLQGQ